MEIHYIFLRCAQKPAEEIQTSAKELHSNRNIVKIQCRLLCEIKAAGLRIKVVLLKWTETWLAQQEAQYIQNTLYYTCVCVSHVWFVSKSF